MIRGPALAAHLIAATLNRGATSPDTRLASQLESVFRGLPPDIRQSVLGGSLSPQAFASLDGGGRLAVLWAMARGSAEQLASGLRLLSGGEAVAELLQGLPDNRLSPVLAALMRRFLEVAGGGRAFPGSPGFSAMAGVFGNLAANLPRSTFEAIVRNLMDGERSTLGLVLLYILSGAPAAMLDELLPGPRLSEALERAGKRGQKAVLRALSKARLRGMFTLLSEAKDADSSARLFGLFVEAAAERQAGAAEDDPDADLPEGVLAIADAFSTLPPPEQLAVLRRLYVACLGGTEAVPFHRLLAILLSRMMAVAGQQLLTALWPVLAPYGPPMELRRFFERLHRILGTRGGISLSWLLQEAPPLSALPEAESPAPRRRQDDALELLRRLLQSNNIADYLGRLSAAADEVVLDHLAELLRYRGAPGMDAIRADRRLHQFVDRIAAIPVGLEPAMRAQAAMAVSRAVLAGDVRDPHELELYRGDLDKLLGEEPDTTLLEVALAGGLEDVLRLLLRPPTNAALLRRTEDLFDLIIPFLAALLVRQIPEAVVKECGGTLEAREITRAIRSGFVDRGARAAQGGHWREEPLLAFVDQSKKGPLKDAAKQLLRELNKKVVAKSAAYQTWFARHLAESAGT
ncbi:MAG: hypothetical protein HYV63_03015 [Candidatus Schekmanbacteria bacterium]|nr:hypothetical protein [Candidatus Schekmanbacteria bacterium]